MITPSVEKRQTDLQETVPYFSFSPAEGSFSSTVPTQVNRKQTQLMEVLEQIRKDTDALTKKYTTEQ